MTEKTYKSRTVLPAGRSETDAERHQRKYKTTWKRAELLTLWYLKQDGYTWTRVACILGRSVASCMHHHKKQNDAMADFELIYRRRQKVTK